MLTESYKILIRPKNELTGNVGNWEHSSWEQKDWLWKLYMRNIWFLQQTIASEIKELESIIQTEPKRHIEQNCGFQGKGLRGGMDWEFGTSRHKLLHKEWIKTRSNCISQGTVFSMLW